MEKITFHYQNYRGEWGERTITPLAIEFIKNPGYSYQPGWFLSGFDHDKKAHRSFALSHIKVGDKPMFSLRLDRY